MNNFNHRLRINLLPILSNEFSSTWRRILSFFFFSKPINRLSKIQRYSQSSTLRFLRTNRSSDFKGERGKDVSHRLMSFLRDSRSRPDISLGDVSPRIRRGWRSHLKFDNPNTDLGFLVECAHVAWATREIRVSDD